MLVISLIVNGIIMFLRAFFLVGNMLFIQVTIFVSSRVTDAIFTKTKENAGYDCHK